MRLCNSVGAAVAHGSCCMHMLLQLRLTECACCNHMKDLCKLSDGLLKHANVCVVGVTWSCTQL
jgi:hypothetical protein